MSVARKVAEPKPWQLEIATGVKTLADPACVGIGENLDPEGLLNFAIDSRFNHICQKNGHLFDEEIKSANRIIDSDDNYFKFPISTILAPDAVNASSEKSFMLTEDSFDSSGQKSHLLANVTNAMQAKAIPQTIMDDVIAVADELFTNAIFNAPFVDMHTHKNPGVNRSALDVKLEGGKKGRLFLAHDANRLVIGCEDPYGSLDLPRYLSKVRSTYQRGPAAAINFGPGGAGIGSYIIFNAGSSLFFGVWPGHATLLCCVLPLGMSNRKRIQLSKHVHWIQR